MKGGVGKNHKIYQNLVIFYKICLQLENVFYELLEGKMLKIRKQSFHMQNKFSVLFLEILTNTNNNKCCQMFLTFLKRYLACFLFTRLLPAAVTCGSYTF